MEIKKNEMFASLDVLKTALVDAKNKIESFYYPMRWESLGLSMKEYENLYDSGKIYQIEETDILNTIEKLQIALKEIL